MTDIFVQRARNHHMVRELRERNDSLAIRLGEVAKELQAARERLEAAAARAVPR